MLRLDHASLYVPSLDEAVARFERAFPSAIVRTPGVREHARLHFDRTYLELRESAEVSAFALRHAFLRAEDLTAEAEALRARGLTVADISRYDGADGAWSELHPRTPDVAVPLPIVRRIEPAAIARDWPPPSALDVRLAGVVIASPDPTAAMEHYARLTGGHAQGFRVEFGPCSIEVRARPGAAPTLIGLRLTGKDAHAALTRLAGNTDDRTFDGGERGVQLATGVALIASRP